ncbi:MAG: DegT/DnrJ/EryC1/StrS family aminotransferase, partial [Terriglobia bacterium]
DITASVALAQLRKLDSLQERRRELWELFQSEFSNLGWLVRPKDSEHDEQHSYFTYCVRILGGQRNRFAKELYEKGIYTTLRYHPLHMNPIYKSNAKLPICEQLNEEALSLPLHPSLSESDVAQIVEAVKSF